MTVPQILSNIKRLTLWSHPQILYKQAEEMAHSYAALYLM
jgi:hypothetical protein